MPIHMMNNLSNPNDYIDIRIVAEPLKDGTLVSYTRMGFPMPSRANKQHIYLHLDRGGVVARMDQSPVSSVSRIVSAWGTEPENADLIRQIQTGNVVRFKGSYTFHSDLGEPGGFTHNYWWRRGAEGAWPPGVCQALRFRGEAYYIGPHDPDSSEESIRIEHAQANYAGGQVQDGETGLPSMGFVTQVKGAGGYASNDNMRVMLEPGGHWVGVMAGGNSRGFFLITGYELLP